MNYDFFSREKVLRFWILETLTAYDIPTSAGKNPTLRRNSEQTLCIQPFEHRIGRGKKTRKPKQPRFTQSRRIRKRYLKLTIGAASRNGDHFASPRDRQMIPPVPKLLLSILTYIQRLRIPVYLHFDKV